MTITEEMARKKLHEYLKRMNKSQIKLFCDKNDIPVVVDPTKVKKEVIKKILSFISPIKEKKGKGKRELNKYLEEELLIARFELNEYDKEDLKAFIRKEFLPVRVTSRMDKEYILEAILKAMKNKKKAVIEKLLQKKSIFGHKEGTVKAFLDERFYKGSIMEEMAKDIVLKSFADTEDDAYRIIKDHIDYLPSEKGIILMLTLKPNPIKNHVVAMFDREDKRGIFDRSLRHL